MMRKDQTKKNAMRRRALRHTAGRIRFRWVLLLSVVVISIFMIGFAQHGKINSFETFNAPFKKLMTWFAEHKQTFRQNMNQVKKLTKNEEKDPQIHFEFYTTLPKMQMKLPNQITEITSAAKSVEKTMVTKSDEKLLNVASAFLNPEQLEKEFAKEIKQPVAATYIVQIASFRNANSALHLRETLNAVGFQASVTKLMTAENAMYRVQLGPFLDKSQAKLALKELQKKGKYGILRKIDS